MERRKQKYKKRTIWTDVSEEMLMEMWEDKILQLRSNRRNSHVYAEIAAELQKKYFPVSAVDVQAKIHNLTSRYRKENALVGPSGGSPSEWPLYERIHTLLGSYRYYNVSQNTMDSIPVAATEEAVREEAARDEAAREEAAAEPCQWELSELLSDESSASSSPVASPLASPDAELIRATRPAKNNNFQQVILKGVTEVKELIQAQVKKMDQADAEMMETETRKTELLQKLVDKQCIVLDSIMEYLKNKQ